MKNKRQLASFLSDKFNGLDDWTENDVLSFLVEFEEEIEEVQDD